MNASDALVHVLDGFASIARRVGPGGMFLAAVAALTLGLILWFAELVVKLLDRFLSVWRKLPRLAQQGVVIFAVVFFGWPVLQAVTGRAVLLALILGAGAAWWTGGLMLARRYPDRSFSSPHRAWAHHLRVRSDTARLTRAVEAGTTKKNGRATAVRREGDRTTFVAEPPDGMSPAEFADDVNTGKLHPSTAREMGWETTKAMAAAVLPDGRVKVSVAHEVAKDSIDLAAHTFEAPEIDWAGQS